MTNVRGCFSLSANPVLNVLTTELGTHVKTQD